MRSLDKLDELVDAVKFLTINDAKYYESSTATASDTQVDLTRNPETVNHTIHGNETFNHTSNRNFEQKIFSNRTIPIFPPTMNPGTDQRIEPTILAPQTLLTPTTKEVVTYTASSGECINRTPRQVSRLGVDGSTPGEIRDSVRFVEPPSPVMIGIVATSPPCGLNAIQ